MAFTVGDWMTFLQGADTLIGLPLLVAGAALMVAGWRLWKVCVVLSFGLIGAGLGQRLAGSADGSSYYALVAGVVLGVLSYFPARQSVAVLGGLIGTALAMYVLADAGLNGAPLWLVGAAVFLCCTAMAYTNRKTVVVAVTAVLGAALLMSGISVLIMMSPSMYAQLSSIAAASSLVGAFFLLVPAVVSYFVQAGEMRRLDVEI